jgi:hypothetical protein
MPQLQLSPGIIAGTSAINIAAIKIRNNLARGDRQIAGTSIISLAQVHRRRSVQLAPATFSGEVTGGLKQLLRFSNGEVVGKLDANVLYFLNASPIAPPTGTLYRAALPTQGQPNFNGSALTQGDLHPVSISIEGQRLLGLTAKFEAQSRGLNTVISITKTNIKLTAPALDPNTQVEKITGNFSFDPADFTIPADLQGIEFAYRFSLGDGMGRSYTLERGGFSVYRAL